jgi:hypothetical protein
MTKLTASKLAWGVLVIFVVLFARNALGVNAPTGIQPPIAEEDWVVSLRFKDPNRYHFGPQEYFRIKSWPEKSPVCIFVGSHSGELACIDPKYGFRRWSRIFKDALIGNIAVHKGYGYVMSQDGILHKIGLYSGNVFWQESFGVAVVSDILVDDHGAYFLTATAELWHYNLESREVLWRYEDEIFQKLTFLGGSRPVRSHDGKLIIIGVPSGGVVAVHDNSGRRAWEHVLDIKHVVDDVDATPTLLPDKTLLVSSVQSETQLIQSVDGKQLHAWPFGSPRGGALWETNNQWLYLLPGLDSVKMINIKTRKVVSNHSTPVTWGYPQAPVLINMEPVYALLTYSQGPAVMVNMETFDFTPIHRSMTGYSAPPLILSDTLAQVILYSNFGNVWKLHLNLAQLAKGSGNSSE